MPLLGSARYDLSIDAYLEVGKKKTFAGALEWPGWCRSGRDGDEALQALVDYGERYERVLRGTGLKFSPPRQLAVKEKLEGDTTTDFGAPGMAPHADSKEVKQAEVERLE